MKISGKCLNHDIPSRRYSRYKSGNGKQEGTSNARAVRTKLDVRYQGRLSFVGAIAAHHHSSSYPAFCGESKKQGSYAYS